MSELLSPKAKQRAREIAESAPPISPERMARIRAILRRYDTRTTPPS